MRLPRQPLVVFAIALAGACWGAPARAASEPTPSEISVARRLFAEGRKAEEAAHWAEAADRFRRATAIKDTPGIRFHLAHCDEEQGKLVEALVEYDRARELIEGGVRAADVERLLPAARERVRAKVALLTLELPPGVQNVAVELDGQALSASVLGVPMPINPGKHRLSAVAAGRTAFESEVDLGSGEVKQLSIELPIQSTVPSGAAAGPSSAPPATPGATAVAGAAGEPRDRAVPTRTVLLIGEGSLATAGLATGVVFLLMRSSADDRYQRASAKLGELSDDPGLCARQDRPAECSELGPALDDRTRATTWAAVGLATAGVSLAAFGLTYWLWPAGEAPAQLSAAVTPCGATAVLTGRF